MQLPHPESPMPDDKPPVLARKSLFREVPWRWSDVLIGFAPMALTTVSGLVINPAWLPVGPHWLWLPFMALGLAWILGYPLWVVRRHCQLPRLPRPRTFFVEALFALLGTVVTMVVLAVVFSFLISLFGERAATTMPLRPIAESSNALAMVVMAQSIAATPRLGVIGENHTRGCVITEVVPQSAADEAGLHVGDVIVKFDGEPIPDFASLIQAVRKTQIGQTVVVEFIRGKDVQRVEVVMKKLRE